MSPVSLAHAIPAKARQAIYSLLATAVGLEVVLDVIPAGVESKVMGVLVVLGFGMAIPNVQVPRMPIVEEVSNDV